MAGFIKDVYGKQRLKAIYLASGQSIELDLSQVEPGVYFIRYFDENGNGLTSEKLVKK